MAYATINKPNLQFNTALYTGNGSTLTVTGVGFQPDFTWLKERSAAGNHKLADVIRGTTKYLSSNLTDAEDTTGSGIQSWNSDGFSLSNATDFNDNGTTYASWNWKANGAGVANTAGTISSTVSANTTSGFSVVSYTSPNSASDQTVGHGLGVAPSFIITKNLDSAFNWDIHHKSLSSGHGLLFTTDAPRAGVFGSMTSTTFGTKTSYTHNSTNRYVAYCFAEVKGFSKAFSYTGNGSTDGTFVYCGFRPAYVLIKYTSGTGQDWYIWDNKRVTYNPNNNIQTTNTSQADTITSVVDLDILSNGFKCRNTNGGYNASGGNYIGIAFAEQPLVGTNNVPATAR